MKRKSLIYVLILTLGLFSCQSKQPKEEETTEPEGKVKKELFFTIPFAEIIKNKREVNLSEIAENIEIIPLENTKESLIGNVMNVELTRDYIFVKHNGSRLLTQFTRDGKFVRHFGTEGRGPKEYALMRLFSVDEENELVYIHTNWTRKILVFNFNGEHVKTIKFEGIGRGHFSWSRDSFLVSFSEPHMGTEPFVFIETNFQGDTLQGVKNHTLWEKKGERSFTVSYWGRNAFYRANNKLHMKGWYNDTVYTYNDNKQLVPRYLVDLGEHKIPLELIPERQSPKPVPGNCVWVGLNESSDYIFVRWGSHWVKNKKEDKAGCILYNKNTREGTALVSKGEEYGFVNDLSGGPDFIPRFSNDTLTFVDISALDMKLYLDSDKFKNSQPKFSEEKEKLIQLDKTLKEDENHFLMIARLNE